MAVVSSDNTASLADSAIVRDERAEGFISTNIGRLKAVDMLRHLAAQALITTAINPSVPAATTGQNHG